MKLEADLRQLETDHSAFIQRLDEQYKPQITTYENKLKGVLDPMEETLGLFKVIFSTPPDADPTEKEESRYKWMAGSFPLLVIFLTLFVLDLIPILIKFFSRPGPYDALIEETEFYSEINMRALRRAYPGIAWAWAVNGAKVQGSIFDRQNPDPPFENDGAESEGTA